MQSHQQPGISRWWRVIGGLSMNLALGTLYGWSVFVAPLEKQFGWKRADTSMVFTIAVTVFALSFVVAGRIQDKYGPLYCSLAGGFLVSLGFFLCSYTTSLTYLFICFGVIGGLGNGFGYATPIPVMAKWFPDKRGLAIGLAVGGYGAGSAIFGPLAQLKLIPAYGLPATFQILAAIFFVMTMVGALLLKNPPGGYRPPGWIAPVAAVKHAATLREFSPGEMLRTPTFYLMWVGYALGCSAGLMVISQLVPFARSVGIEAAALSTMTLVVGAVGNASGRILSGWMSDKLGRINVLRTMIGISMVAMPALYAAGSNVVALYVAVFVVYWCYGTQLSVNGVAASDFWGTKNAGINYGLLFTAWGVAGIIGPRIAGVLFDRYHNYQAAFYTAAALAAVALVCELSLKRPAAAILLLTIGLANAQTSPDELAKSISPPWSKINRVMGLSSVIRRDEKRAVLLLSGVPLTGNSGDETIEGMQFSGVYRAVAESGRWKLEPQIPLEDLGEILSQRLLVRLRPGAGVDVDDRLLVRVKSNNGFAARLNHAAKITSVESGGKDVQHQSGGGLLWADLPAGQAEMTLKYSLEIETAPKDPNSGCFTERFGHIRNQYFWHPAFGFSSAGDQADFQIEVRIPKEYGLTTSLPQTESFVGNERIIQGKTVERTSTLTLAYDRDWQTIDQTAGKTHLQMFVTPGFRPAPAAVFDEFRSVYSFLASRFGDPGNGYIAVVQLRADPGNYWHFNSNQAVFAAGSPGSLFVKDKDPSANLGHEIGHFWTHGTGPAANFLREGWARYVESLVLEREFGRDTVELFWKQQARPYFQYYEGKQSMLGSGNGNNLNYYKGSWVFRMLEDAVGTEAFQKAMTEFSLRSRTGAADWESLAECFQHQNAPGFDARQFLLPWLQEKTAPHLTARTEGRTVTIQQDAPVFFLPVTVEGQTPEGTERHRVWIRGKEATVQFAKPVSALRIDPDELLLLRR